MSRSQEDWLALEDLGFWSFLKIAFLLSALLMAPGLLTFALLDDVGWAMLVFLGTLIPGISARLWQDRKIKRVFRENPERSPRQVIDEVRLRRHRRRTCWGGLAERQGMESSEGAPRIGEPETARPSPGPMNSYRP